MLQNAYNMLHSDMVAAVRIAHACCMFLDELSTTYLFPAHHNVNDSANAPNNTDVCIDVYHTLQFKISLT